MDSEAFGDEHARDHTVVVAQSASPAHQPCQPKPYPQEFRDDVVRVA